MADEKSATIELGGLFQPSGKKVSLNVLKRTANRIFRRRPDLAEEATQEAALRLLQVADVKNILDPDSYAAVAVRHAALDLLAQENRYRNFDEWDELHQWAAPSPFPDDAIERLVLLTETLAAIRKHLDDRQYKLTELLLQGHTKSSIARILGVSRQTVHTDLKTIKALIMGLDPPNPPDDGGNDNGGGGGGGIRLPPIRGDPLRWVFKAREVRRVAVLQDLEPSESKEIPDDLESQGGCMPRHAQARRRRQSGADAPAKAALEDLKRLLLQLPAFREAGLSPSEEPAVQDLDEVVSRFVFGRPDRRRH